MNTPVARIHTFLALFFCAVLGMVAGWAGHANRPEARPRPPATAAALELWSVTVSWDRAGETQIGSFVGPAENQDQAIRRAALELELRWPGVRLTTIRAQQVDFAAVAEVYLAHQGHGAR